MGQTYGNSAGDSNSKPSVDAFTSRSVGNGKTKSTRKTFNTSAKLNGHSDSQSVYHSSVGKPVGYTKPKPRKLPPLDLGTDSRTIQVTSPNAYDTHRNQIELKTKNKPETNQK